MEDRTGDYEQAREVALHFLDYAPRSSAEVRRRLARGGFEEVVVEAVVADLEGSGLLDDARLSRAWVEDRAPRKGYGRARLATELRRKGVDRDLVEQATSGMDAEAEYTAARELVRKRLGATDAADPAARRRLVGYLHRRGYDWEVIERALDSLRGDDAGDGPEAVED